LGVAVGVAVGAGVGAAVTAVVASAIGSAVAAVPPAQAATTTIASTRAAIRTIRPSMGLLLFAAGLAVRTTTMSHVNAAHMGQNRYLFACRVFRP